jgi:transketolase
VPIWDREVPFGWHKWVGLEGEIHGIERFGASAPYKDLQREFGFRPEDVVKRVEGMVGR